MNTTRTDSLLIERKIVRYYLMRIPPLLLALLAAPPSELLLAQATKRPFSINDDVLAYPQVRYVGILWWLFSRMIG